MQNTSYTSFCALQLEERFSKIHPEIPFATNNDLPIKLCSLQLQPVFSSYYFH